MIKKIKSFVSKIGNRGKALICGAVSMVSSCAMAAVASASDATSGSTGFDMATAVQDAGQSIQNQFGAMVTTLIPILIGCLMSGLGIYAVFILIKLAKKAFGSVTS